MLKNRTGVPYYQGWLPDAAVAVILSAVVCCAGCMRPAGLVDRQTIDAAEEDAVIRIGHSEAAAQAQTVVAVVCPEVQESIQRLVDELAEVAQCDMECRVHLINSPHIRAFALASGDIFINAGMLDHVENRDQLAFILAHEVAHISNGDSLHMLRHSFRQQESAAFRAAISGALMSSIASAATSVHMQASLEEQIGPEGGPLYDLLIVTPAANVAARLAGRMPEPLIVHLMRASGEKYSRQTELTADDCAVKYAKAAGYDPQAGLDFRRRLEIIRRQFEDSFSEDR